MAGKLTQAIAVIIIIGLIVPAAYLTMPLLTAKVSTGQPRGYRYSSAENVTISPAVAKMIFASLAGMMSPNDLNRLREELNGVTQFASAKEDPIGDYLNTLSTFSDNMVKIKDGLGRARAYVESGNTRTASAEVNQLVGLRSQTEPLIGSLYRLLDKVKATYDVDVSTELRRVNELDNMFQSYAVQIDQISNALKPLQQALIQTVLIINTTKREVLAGESFSIDGVLREQNGTGLPFRNVTISWNLNYSVSRITDIEGRFKAIISFPLGSPSGFSKVTVTYQPELADKTLYAPTSGFILVQVGYLPTVVSAEITPPTAKPLDLVYIKGNLSTINMIPVPNRTVILSLDGTPLGDASTDSSGNFLFRFAVLQTLTNGTHAITVAFTPIADRFEASNTTLAFNVEFLKTEIKYQIDRSWIFSGMNVTLHGIVTDANGTAIRSGSVIVYVDNVRYAHSEVDNNGTFTSAINLPLGPSVGTHTIRIEYKPDLPWLQGSEAVASVFVFNTPLIILAAVAIPIASALVTIASRRRKHAAVTSTITVPQPLALERPPFRTEFTFESLMSAVESEADNARKVKRAYTLAKAMINEKLGETSRESETHWEYFARVTKTLPMIAGSLRRLVELYEQAEYTPYPIDDEESREATEALLTLREEIEV